MEIINRSDAIKKGLSKYFTGIPCKNLHLTYRYTTSGSCSACIRSYAGPIGILREQNALREKLSLMVDFQTRVFDEDLEFFRTLVYISAKEHEPTIQPQNVWKLTTGSKREANSAIHTFRAFFSDVEPLRKMALELFSQRTLKNVEPVRVECP